MPVPNYSFSPYKSAPAIGDLASDSEEYPETDVDDDLSADYLEPLYVNTPGPFSTHASPDSTSLSADSSLPAILKPAPPRVDPTASRAMDSVIHYFVATDHSEAALDSYFSAIIKAFLSEPSRIYASAPLDGPVSSPPPPSTVSVPPFFTNSSIPASMADAPIERYLESIKTYIIDKATRVSAPKMIGHMTTALPYFHRPLARLLTALNQNVVKLETASTLTFLERETGAMLHRAFYNRPEEYYTRILSVAYNLASRPGPNAADPGLFALFGSGGTVANISALWIARNRALGPCWRTRTGAIVKKRVYSVAEDAYEDLEDRVGLDSLDDDDAAVWFAGVEKEGVFAAMKFYGYEKAVVVGTRMMHYSMRKAVDVLGLGDGGLVLIDTDERFRVRTDMLEAKVEELRSQKVLVIAVIAVAGTTEAGSIDDIQALSHICNTHSIHLHVDAAWGGPLIFSPEHESKLWGISNAHTITIDPHKQLYTPMGLGVLLVRSPIYVRSIMKTANYIVRPDSVDSGKFGMEGSRPGLVLHAHASLSLLGQEGLGSLVTRSCSLVRQLAARVGSKGGMVVVGDAVSNILLLRCLPRRMWGFEAAKRDEDEEREVDMLVRDVHARIARSEGGFVSRTRVIVKGTERDVLRVVIANPCTKWEDVESVVEDVRRAAEEVEREEEARRSVVGKGGVWDVPELRAWKFEDDADERVKSVSRRIEEWVEERWVGWPFDL